MAAGFTFTQPLTDADREILTDEALVSARRAFFAGMNALGDAISSHCPPEREVSFDWPDAGRFDGGS